MAALSATVRRLAAVLGLDTTSWPSRRQGPGDLGGAVVQADVFSSQRPRFTAPKCRAQYERQDRAVPQRCGGLHER